MGINYVTADYLLEHYRLLIKSSGGLTFSFFKVLVRDLATHFNNQPNGRNYALLSLDEAEHFRGIMHGRKGRSLIPGEEKTGRTHVALWLMASDSMVLLDSTPGFQHFTTQPQHMSMVNSYRFLNSDTHYDENALTVMLRILENNTCEDRAKWWTDIRACRRRRQLEVNRSMPIFTVFHSQSEYQYNSFRSEVVRIKAELVDRGMLVFDAFRAFNSSNSGVLNCSEIYGGMEFLGIPFTPEEIYELVRRLAIEHEVKSFHFPDLINF